ncbi:uncharacterized, partial [Tachysurus ichikawai]
QLRGIGVVPAAAAGGARLAEWHGSRALEQLGQKLQHQRNYHDPQHCIGLPPLPFSGSSGLAATTAGTSRKVLRQRCSFSTTVDQAHHIPQTPQ